MTTQRLVFFDIEAAGVDPKRHPIIQLAAIAVDERLEMLEAFEAKIKFDSRKAKAHSLRKNHYHPGIWAQEAREKQDVVRDFAEFLRRHATVSALSGRGEPYHVAQLAAHTPRSTRRFSRCGSRSNGSFCPPDGWSSAPCNWRCGSMP